MKETDKTRYLDTIKPIDGLVSIFPEWPYFYLMSFEENKFIFRDDK